MVIKKITATLYIHFQRQLKNGLKDSYKTRIKLLFCIVNSVYSDFFTLIYINMLIFIN